MPEFHFQRGQPISFRLGMREVHGIVKEDRGRIGVNGRRLYLIEYPTEPGSPYRSLIELPADQFKALPGVIQS
jgi:hypothetical protein